MAIDFLLLTATGTCHTLMDVLQNVFSVQSKLFDSRCNREFFFAAFHVSLCLTYVTTQKNATTFRTQSNVPCVKQLSLFFPIFRYCITTFPASANFSTSTQLQHIAMTEFAIIAWKMPKTCVYRFIHSLTMQPGPIWLISPNWAPRLKGPHASTGRATVWNLFVI